MSLRDITITAQTPQWHDAFIRYVPRVFSQISFRGWYDLGSWDAGYRAFAVADGDDVIANASLQRMTVVLGGRELTGWQLGAVGVVPEYRGKGLQRRIMARLMAEPGPDDLVFLFANDSVLEFYPRFGFRRVIEHIHGVDIALAPAGDRRLRRLSLHSPDDRALLQRLAARSLPVTGEFGARDYGGVLLWYWVNFHQDHFYFDDRDEAIIVAVEHPGWLELCDVVAATHLDLPTVLPALIDRPVSRIEFGFTPEICWPEALVIREYTDSPLFVLGRHALPAIPFKYPVLAQT